MLIRVKIKKKKIQSINNNKDIFKILKGIRYKLQVQGWQVKYSSYLFHLQNLNSEIMLLSVKNERIFIDLMKARNTSTILYYKQLTIPSIFHFIHFPCYYDYGVPIFIFPATIFHSTIFIPAFFINQTIPQRDIERERDRERFLFFLFSQKNKKVQA